ncbi:hypothetical protein, partial [Pseudonocardia saturnea]
VALGDEPMPEESEFLNDCLGVGRQMLMQRRLDRPDSVSRELYATALRLAENRELLDSSSPGARRADWQTEVGAVIEDLGRLADLHRARLQVVLGDGDDQAAVPAVATKERAEGDSGVAS